MKYEYPLSAFTVDMMLDVIANSTGMFKDVPANVFTVIDPTSDLLRRLADKELYPHINIK